jgi:hypothetical protein
MVGYGVRVLGSGRKRVEIVKNASKTVKIDLYLLKTRSRAKKTGGVNGIWVVIVVRERVRPEMVRNGWVRADFVENGWKWLFFDEIAK